MSDRGLRPFAATAALILAGLALTACDSNDVPGASALTGDDEACGVSSRISRITSSTFTSLIT